ncbi:putative Ig domain-containing protein [Streptomyces sp. NPDC048419]|uniref:putative Ig domain-containing protein n=1 Tax=Streptomyces sp. NPDC048419 TaxID=3365547 RepID=UPI0037138A51
MNGHHTTILPHRTIRIFTWICCLTLVLFGAITLGAPGRATAASAPSGPSAYVANSSSNSVSVVDTNSNTAPATIDVGSRPINAAVSPDGTHAYVTNAGSKTVSVIDTNSNKVTATIGVGTAPTGVAVSPDGTHAYVTNDGSNSVSVIDTSNNTATATIGVGSGAVGVAVSPDGTHAYVTNAGSNTVSVIDTSNNTVTATIDVGSGKEPNDVAISPDGTHAYVTNENDNSVSVIDTSNNTVTTTIGVGFDPQDVVVSPDGTRAYVTNVQDNSVSVIDTSSNRVTATVHVGTGPIGVAISPDGKHVYVANFGSQNVSVIDTGSNTVTATVGVGNGPWGVGIASGLAPTISGTPPAGTVGTAYSYHFILGGNPTPTTTVTSGTLPNGLTLSSGGLLSGTPTQGGSFPITVTAKNSAGTATDTATVVIHPAATTLTVSASPSPADAGQKVTLQATVTGSSPTGTVDFYDGSTSGQALNSSPVAVGSDDTASFITSALAAGSHTITAVYSGDDSNAGSQGSTPLTVNAALAVTTSSLPDATVGQAYGADHPVTLQSSGGQDPITWSASGLPDGLSLDKASGVISGTPSADGKFSVTVTATDANRQSDKATLPLTVAGASSATSVSATPSPADAGQQVTLQATVTGGGATPTGTVNFYNGDPSSTPALNTTPVAVGSDGKASFTTSALAAGDHTITAVYSGDGTYSTSQDTTPLTVNKALAVTTTSLPDGTAGAAYPGATLASNGGTTPITWSANGLPGGLTLDSKTGAISGTPTTAGTSTVTVTATDANSQSATATLKLTINPAATQAPKFTNPNTTTVQPGVPISGGPQVTTTGTPTPTLKEAGTLPKGVSFKDNGDGTGSFTGTPATTSSGSYKLTLTATNSAGSATQTYTLVVGPYKADLKASLAGPAHGTAGSKATYTLTITNNGPAPAQGVNLLINSAGLTGVTATGGPGVTVGNPTSIKIAGITVSGTHATVTTPLASGKSVTLSLAGTLPSHLVKSVTITGATWSTTPDPSTSNNLTHFTTTIP